MSAVFEHLDSDGDRLAVTEPSAGGLTFHCLMDPDWRPGEVWLDPAAVLELRNALDAWLGGTAPTLTPSEAVELIRSSFPSDSTIVICGDAVEETSRVKRDDGSFQVVTAPKGYRKPEGCTHPGPVCRNDLAYGTES